MGGGFDPKTKVIDCAGQEVTAKLNQVFRIPGTPQYKYAQAHNTFDKVQQNDADNWLALLDAYKAAGVNVGIEGSAWSYYLSVLGQENIYTIAQTRFNALTNNQGINTITHGGGGPVRVSAGTIDSPCPPP